jgi:hypothetical protein
MNNSNFEVALAKEVCRVCAKQFDGPIMQNEVEKAATKKRHINNY